MQAFDETETALTATAGTLQNTTANQGLAFPIWGNPEREKINQIAPAVNIMAMGMGG
jgi:hypothetical protein